MTASQRSVSEAPRSFSKTVYRSGQHGSGVNSWIYRYANDAPLARSWVGCGLELGVQVKGTWSLASRWRSRRAYNRGDICRVSVGERYHHSHEGRTQEGLQIGFIVCDAMTSEQDGELRFPGDAGMLDRTFFEFAEWFATESPVPDATVIEEVRGYIRRHAVLVSASPVILGKRELERNFIYDLSIDHLATVGGLHPETFTRQFKAAYGMTPAAYRIMLRTNYASRLLWSRPDLSVAEIAEESGFPNRSYFHRTFHRHFGMTASQARARHTAP